MKLSTKRTNEMREMMLALTDQEGRVGMNESRSSGSGGASETSLLKFYLPEINILFRQLLSTFAYRSLPLFFLLFTIHKSPL